MTILPTNKRNYRRQTLWTRRIELYKSGGCQRKRRSPNQKRFLVVIYELNDKKMIYWRKGSCYPIKTAPRFNNIGEIGSRDTLTLYLKMYDKDDLKFQMG